MTHKKAYLTEGVITANKTEGATEDLTPSGVQPSPHPPQAPGLVIVWSAAEPHRVGEILLPPKGGKPVIVGRGDHARHTRLKKIHPMRQIPGANLQCPPLQARRISREQLKVSALSARRISVENLGKAPMTVGGKATSQATLTPGMILTLQDQLTLLCVSRLPVLGGEEQKKVHPLGLADDKGMVGESPALWRLRQLILFIAPRPGHVLILGQSGVGKELVAKAIHHCSPRGSHGLISRNAATLPEGLIDAELFGHAQGYPNAGMPERHGLVGDANNSSLFLDEVGELSIDLQAHLLRLMDQGEYQRLGDGRVRRADIRIIAATNQPLTVLKADFAARFRHVITVPSLSERKADIPLIAAHLMKKAAAADHLLQTQFMDEQQQPRFSQELIGLLLQHPLPLQIRELDNLLWQALAESQGSRITPPSSLLNQVIEGPTTIQADAISLDILRDCLDKHGGVQAKVWRELGLANRYVLRRLMQKYGLNAPKNAR